MIVATPHISPVNVQECVRHQTLLNAGCHATSTGSTYNEDPHRNLVLYFIHMEPKCITTNYTTLVHRKWSPQITIASRWLHFRNCSGMPIELWTIHGQKAN